MKRKTRSFQFKLWMYFILFTAFIFTVLWLLQTVFLQSFYDAMLISNTKAAAEKISANSRSESVDTLIDELAHNNTILVFVTDQSGNVLYAADEFRQLHSKRKNGPDEMGRHGDGKRDSYRMLPDGYDSFLSELKSSSTGVTEKNSGSLYVYGTYIDYYNCSEPAVLYVGTTLDTVGSSVSIISMQLVWVTLLSLLSGFVLSWFIARRFSSPLASLSEKARHLGEKEYSPGFRKGFCSELDQLSTTLDTTNDKLNRSRDFQMELLANVSHDLRTPVTMIKGYAEMIRDISWEDEEQCRKDLEVVIKEADRLTALVNEIMEYSELQTDTVHEDFVPVDMSRLVRKVADSFDTLYKPEGIRLERQIAEGISVSGSGSRLERALFNLMDNAFRHTGNGRNILVSLTAGNGTAVLAVTDYGEGIPADELPHIWDRYYTSRQRKGKGVSGLGLAIVRQITEMHGGTCDVTTQQGKGSTFRITLPLFRHDA